MTPRTLVAAVALAMSTGFAGPALAAVDAASLVSRR